MSRPQSHTRPSDLPLPERRRIEQAIARTGTAHDAATELGLDYATVKAVLESMETP